MLRQEDITSSLVGEGKASNNDPFREVAKRRLKHKKDHRLSSGGYLQQQRERCPERVAWEQSWERVRLGRPSFRDRVRVWQSISELKRAGARGKMGITNDEAWVALHDSFGSASAAATLLSNEEYLLGRRLQQRDEQRGLNKVPPHLSLSGDVRDVGQSSSGHSPLARRPSFQSNARPCSLGTGDFSDRKRTTDAEPRSSCPKSNIFCCVSDLFYAPPKTTTKTVMLAVGKS